MRRPLFVYGTLTAEAGHPLLAGVPRLGPAWVIGSLWALDAGYPALALDDGGPVHGELVAGVDDEVLAALDAYEGVDEGLYERVTVSAHHGDRVCDAWAWIMHQPERHPGERLPLGRWTPGHTHQSTPRPTDDVR